MNQEIIEDKALIGWIAFNPKINEYYTTNQSEWYYTSFIRKAEIFESREEAIRALEFDRLELDRHEIIEIELTWCAKRAEDKQLNLDGL